jgi:hypothetical protein
VSVEAIVIEDLALSESELLERVASLEADVGVYRELTGAAFDALRRLTVRYQRLQESSNRLRDEYRELREQLLLNAGADEPRSAAA